jgi:hypothetical protein
MHSCLHSCHLHAFLSTFLPLACIPATCMHSCRLHVHIFLSAFLPFACISACIPATCMQSMYSSHLHAFLLLAFLLLARRPCIRFYYLHANLQLLSPPLSFLPLAFLPRRTASTDDVRENRFRLPEITTFSFQTFYFRLHYKHPLKSV